MRLLIRKREDSPQQAACLMRENIYFCNLSNTLCRLDLSNRIPQSLTSLKCNQNPFLCHVYFPLWAKTELMDRCSAKYYSNAVFYVWQSNTETTTKKAKEMRRERKEVTDLWVSWRGGVASFYKCEFAWGMFEKWDFIKGTTSFQWFLECLPRWALSCCNCILSSSDYTCACIAKLIV